MKNILMIGLLCLTFFAGQETFAQETPKKEPTLVETLNFLKEKIDGSEVFKKGSYKASVLIAYNYTFTYKVKEAEGSIFGLEESYSYKADWSGVGPSTKTCSTGINLYLDQIIPASIKVREWEGNFVVDMNRAKRKIFVNDKCTETGFGDNNDFFGQKNADSFGIVFSDKETAEKVAKALTHAVKLNGGKEELF